MVSERKRWWQLLSLKLLKEKFFHLPLPCPIFVDENCLEEQAEKNKIVLIAYFLTQR